MAAFHVVLALQAILPIVIVLRGRCVQNCIDGFVNMSGVGGIFANDMHIKCPVWPQILAFGTDTPDNHPL